jgi:ketosteroid isomerase-like protein
MSTADPMATIRHYVDAFNQTSVEGMAAVCDSQMSILDGLPPHVWQGATACTEWYRDVMAAGEHEGATEYSVTLGEPRHLEVRGDCAYLVLPATMAFKAHGRQATQSGAVFTVALRRRADGWRIAAWAWAKGHQ